MKTTKMVMYAHRIMTQITSGDPPMSACAHRIKNTISAHQFVPLTLRSLRCVLISFCFFMFFQSPWYSCALYFVRSYNFFSIEVVN